MAIRDLDPNGTRCQSARIKGSVNETDGLFFDNITAILPDDSGG